MAAWLPGILIAIILLAPTAAGAVTVRAKSADSFVGSIGVNLHLGNTTTPYYQQFDLVKQRLQELGVRHVRGVLYPEAPGLYNDINSLSAVGIKSTLILGDPSWGTSVLDNQLIPVLKGPLAGAVAAVEGPNEYSTSGDPEWKPKLIAYQQRIYNDIKGDPALAALPVIGPSIVHGDQAELGDISSYLDYGNIHSYPEGNPPEKLGSFITSAELNSGSKPIMATETGYTTALNWTPSGNGEQRPVSEQAMATYMPRLFLEYFRWGIPRTMSYELVDEVPDPGLVDREAHWGLLRNDLTPKPAFTAVQNTIRTLEDPGSTFTPGTLTYTLSEGGTELPSGESPELHKVLLQKRDGSFYLAFWRTSSVWDPIAKQPLAAPTKPVTLSLQSGFQAATAYLPNRSMEPAWSISNPSGPLTIEVGPEVVILKLTPPPGPPAGVSVSLSPTSITANGTATATATATVTDAKGNRVAGNNLSFSSTDTGQKMGAVTDRGDGTYSVTITASKTVGSATITATDTSASPAISGTAMLTQAPGPPARVSVSLSPSSIIANGTATATATATVTDASGNPVAGNNLRFSSTDTGQKMGTMTDRGDGTYRVTITASRKTGTATITATDASASPTISGSATLTQTKDPRIVKVTHNLRTGTAELVMMVSGSGELLLRGTDVAPRHVARRFSGRVKLPIVTHGRSRKSLRRHAEVAVEVTVTFTPDLGKSVSRIKNVKLIMRDR